MLSPVAYVLGKLGKTLQIPPGVQLVEKKVK